ncbi:ribonuclease H-like domain-containing protein [Tanacetum coccineum]|uniref:Ribonuclease H-like domain-containing protein n=1 Tax=Tanacetum coccineum TaxID=301880 RepID=A0ABQ5FP05_9ASTR
MTGPDITTTTTTTTLLSNKLPHVTHQHLLTRLKVDKIVLSWIFSTFSDTLQARLVVVRPKLTKEAWGLISDIVKDNKRSRTNALKVKLRSIKLGDQTTESYFQKIESIVTILTRLDSHVNDEDVVHYALEEMRLKSKSLALPMDPSSSFLMVLMAESGTTHRSSTTNQVKSWRLCFNFTKGACRFSDLCRYVHDPSTRSGTSNNGSTARIHGTNDNESTTNELLAKLLKQLGSLGVNNSVNLVANHTSSMLYVGPNVDPASGAWNMGTGASSHLNASLTSLSDVFNTCIYSSISVDDGHTIPITNMGHSILPAQHGSLHLNNVLITPNIVKNLIYVRQFVRDNNCPVEFDTFGFSIKDFTTRRMLLRCDSTRDLYPVTSPSPIPYAYLVSQHTWH